MFLSKKKIIVIFVILLLLFIFYSYRIISGFVKDGYDRQSKTVEIIKTIIPPHYVKKIKDNFFVVSKLKSRNEYLELQIKKYEQGLDGQIFKSEKIKINNEEYKLDYFFTPFKRLDVNLGWNAMKNSLRAHYLEVYHNKVLLISGEGQTIYFDKKNFLSKKLNYTNLENNINEIIKDNNSELIGIRDLYFHKDEVLISMLEKNDKGVTINIYAADMNFKKLNFKLYFQTNDFWEYYNVFSGGRIEKFSDSEILFSVGYAGVKGAAQNLNTTLGKIIKINTINKSFEIVSIGHRNPQGLRYIKDKNIVINSEHGPKGGDEINFNLLNKNNGELINYGWDIASYGTKYDGTDPFKKSHSKYGFKEPAKFYTPSIGISEILYFQDSSHCPKKNCIWVSSLRANSVYILSLENNFENLKSSDRLHLKKNRLRDIDYDDELDLILLLSENIPAILVLTKI